MRGNDRARVLPGPRALVGFLLLLTVPGACGGEAWSPEPGRAEASPAADATPPSVPRLVALGTAQDGGLPHFSCGCVRCAAARVDPARARRAASLGLILAGGRRFLIDATPDVRAQVHALAQAAGRPPRGGTDRAPVDGIFLTHAHMGHYLGLAFLGYESIHAQGVPVHATPSLAAFLRGSGPWSQLVELGNIVLHELPPGASIQLSPQVSVTALAVPHRDEYSDTVGFVLRGPARTVLYVPDTDGWAAWEPPLLAVLEREDVDVALLDATFFDAGELPGRDPAAIGHPLVTDSMDRLQPLVDAGGLQVFFTHLNHSNPLLEPDSAALREVRRRGFAVLDDGREIPF